MKKATIVRLKQVTHVKNEIALLRTMDHPGLVKMSGMFQTDENLYLILEYINGGELFSHLRSAVRYPDHQVGGWVCCNTTTTTIIRDAFDLDSARSCYNHFHIQFYYIHNQTILPFPAASIGNDLCR